MPGEKVSCPDCGNEVSRSHLSRHRRVHSRGTLRGNQCPNFQPKTNEQLQAHNARKHAVAQSPQVSFIFFFFCISHQIKSSFYTVNRRQANFLHRGWIYHPVLNPRRPLLSLNCPISLNCPTLNSNRPMVQHNHRFPVSNHRYLPSKQCHPVLSPRSPVQTAAH